MLAKVIRAAAREPSFREAAEALNDLAELTVNARQVDRIAHEMGQHLRDQRDQLVDQDRSGEVGPRVETRPALAMIQVDGGRLQIRGQGQGPGAHQAAWREDKIALLATLSHQVSSVDPEPRLPACFADRSFVERLVGSIAGVGPLGPAPAEPPTSVDGLPPPTPRPAEPRTTPELSVRTYVATLASVDQFGPMVRAEAKSRNFPKAGARVFLGDGSAWIWKLHRREFPSYVAIVDFLHVLGHLFTAAKGIAVAAPDQWALFTSWAEACWQGDVDRVIAELETWCEVQRTLCGGFEDLAADDPRRLVRRELGYLESNRHRMDYPGYRRDGLPWTTSHVESTVKMFNRRVKGTEKFWGEEGGETMLQLRAALLSEDGRLDRHLKGRPSSPFRNYNAKTRKTGKAA